VTAPSIATSFRGRSCCQQKRLMIPKV